jgi:phage/plasmid-associated DNA primase
MNQALHDVYHAPQGAHNDNDVKNHCYSLFKTSKNNGLNGSSGYTHVSMGNKTGHYYLSATNDHEFYQNYNQLVTSNVPVCLAEKQGDYVPLLGDIDIKIDSEGVQNFKNIRTLYTNEELLATIKCFQETIKKHVLEHTEKALTCVVLEKKPYTSGNFLKNGFHLHFPYLFLDKDKVKNVIIPKIKENISSFKLGNGKKLFSDHTESPENFVDDVTSKCWLMYGSSKSEELKPYKLTEIYNHELVKIQPSEAFKLGQFFTRDEESLNVDDSNVMDLLPQLLSVSPIKKEIFNVKTPTDLKVPTKVYLKQKLKNIDVKEDRAAIKKNLLQAKELLKILKASRADEYNSWWDIGIILFNIGHGCEEAFKIWNEWSQNSDNYDEDACLEMWEKMEKRDPKHGQTKGMGSLRWYAKQDSANKYNEFVEKSHGLFLDENNLFDSVMMVEIMTTDAPLARLLLDMFSDKYIFSDDGWYSFNGTIWAPVKVLKEFRFKLEHISIKYKQFKKKIMEILYQEDTDSGQESDSDDEEEKEKLSKKNKAILTAKKQDINKAINKLENFTSQNGILKMCEVLFYNEEFSELLDDNPLIIAFKNGVFDFETLSFRQGLQSDYLSKTLSIHFDETLNDESDEIKNLNNFLRKICPDKSVRKYFIEQTCEVFRGGNRDKIAMFWTGNGNNGKSVTQRLFETMLGKKFAIKLSTSVLTERIQPGQPNPQLSRLRGGVRWGVFDEWGKTEQILSGSLNVLTGGDSLPCRDLFQKGSESSDFTPMFKMLCICNELPCLKDAVDATWDRIRIIPFEAKFVSREKCPPTLKEQREKKIFLCDTEMTQKDRLESLAKALGWYLIQIFIKKEKTRRDGSYEPTIPDKVNEAKIKYQAKCDVLAFFMEETYIKTDNSDHKITFDDMYVSFKSWYINSFSGKMITLNKHEFIEMVKNKYALAETDRVLKGYTWNRKYDDDSDED